MNTPATAASSRQVSGDMFPDDAFLGAVTLFVQLRHAEAVAL